MLQRVKSLWRCSPETAGEPLEAGGGGVGADVAVAALRHPSGASGSGTVTGLQIQVLRFTALQVHLAHYGTSCFHHR